MRSGATIALVAGAVLLVVAVALWLRASDEAGVSAPRETEPSSADPPERPALDVHREEAKTTALRPGGASNAHEPGESTPTDGASTNGASQPSANATEARLVHVAGVVRDELGFVLADHVIELSTESRIPGELRVIDGSAATDESGRFRIEAVTPGLKDLRVLGPGQGDVWRSIWNVDAPLDKHVELAVEERRLTLDVPESGLDDLVLKCRGHREVLVTARLVDDLYRPIDSRAFQFERDVKDFGRVFSGTDGSISALVTVEQDRSVQLFVDDIASPDLAGQPAEALGPPKRYLPIDVQLGTAPKHQELGMLVVRRMAGLALTLVDMTNGEVVRHASVRFRCTGGGVFPSDETSQTAGQDTSVLWSGRMTGNYELEVSAVGYQPARRVGVLVVGDEPQRLEIGLEPIR